MPQITVLDKRFARGSLYYEFYQVSHRSAASNEAEETEMMSKTSTLLAKVGSAQHKIHPPTLNISFLPSVVLKLMKLTSDYIL
jgi:hypothetical protein